MFRLHKPTLRSLVHTSFLRNSLLQASIPSIKYPQTLTTTSGTMCEYLIQRRLCLDQQSTCQKLSKKTF